MDQMAIAANVRSLLESREMSVADLARAMHITRQSLYKKLSGKATFVRRDVDSFSLIFGVDGSEIMKRHDTPLSHPSARVYWCGPYSHWRST
jgi:transcriptional regulator with XRE-family HTH domain